VKDEFKFAAATSAALFSGVTLAVGSLAMLASGESQASIVLGGAFGSLPAGAVWVGYGLSKCVPTS